MIRARLPMLVMTVSLPLIAQDIGTCEENTRIKQGVTYRLRVNANPTMCIDAAAGGNTKVQQNYCSAARQQWFTFTKYGDKCYVITAVGADDPRRVLAGPVFLNLPLLGDLPDDVKGVAMWQAHDYKDPKYLIVELRQKKGGQECADRPSESTSPGDRINVVKCNNNVAQQWVLEEVRGTQKKKK